jgi:hypothetical protein
MRLLVIILALGIIGWMFYTTYGGNDAETAIPTEYQRSLDKAGSLEESLQESADQRLRDLDNKTP